MDYENYKYILQQFILAKELERQDIAKELHDVTIQSLVTILHQLERFLIGNQSFNMCHIRLLLNLTEQIKTVLQEVRLLSQDLYPWIIDHFGLVSAIQDLTNKLCWQHSIKANLEVIGLIKRFKPEVELNLYRFIQEATKIIINFDKTTEFKVRLEFAEKYFVLKIKENGLVLSKIGFVGIWEILKLIGAHKKITTIDGKESTITISIPYHEII